MKNRAVPVLFMLTLAAALSTATPTAQVVQNDDWCQRDYRNNNDREVACEVREYTVTAAGTMSVDAAPNGGIEVAGGPRRDILVHAKVVAQAESQQRARQIVSAVNVTAAPDKVTANGPDLGRRESWSVSYRLAVPSIASLSLNTTNGGITIRDVDGDIGFRTVNGGVKLTNLAGNVKGRTSNGGVDVDLDGPSWRGEGLDVETSNGGVQLRIPEHYSARLETGTVNGGLNIDFPVQVQGRLDRLDRQINVDIGAGGAPIRVRTHNGGVKVSKKQ